MINPLEITSIHDDLDPVLKKYALRKIGKLDRYVSLKIRKSVHGEIKLLQQEGKANKNERHTCEVILHLPSGTITAKESTLNMFAAIDIVEAKLKNQLRKYKDKHRQPKHLTKRKLFDRLKLFSSRRGQ
ncbi:ribosome-associated translation inhibitor RaiA [Candidatus Saccharibacteria bacterium CPR2]|nr:ribosome-associated translation inhibitor RaiA [Candidatus Saccharibacteria bacterium CPR2]